MKKTIVICAALFALLLLIDNADAEQRNYKFGILVGSHKTEQQYRNIFQDVIDFINRREDVEFEMVWFTEDSDFLEAAGKKQLDVIYTNQFDPFLIPIKDYDYIPFAAISVFGLSDMKVCLFVDRDRDVQSIHDLEGARIITYKTTDGYYPLRRLLGEKPADFFSEAYLSPGGYFSLMKVIEGEADISLIYRSNQSSLAMVNPSMAAQVKEIVCEEGHPFMPLSFRKGMPREDVRHIEKVLATAPKHEALKQYRPAMRSTKLRFYQVGPGDYEKMIDEYNQAVKKGWDKDYEKWKNNLKVFED